MTIANTPTALFGSVPFSQLAARTQGRVAVPGDTDYDALVSPWNVAVPVRPAAVVAAETAEDVVEAVRFAAEHGLRVTPQATGHGPMAELLTELVVLTKGLDEVVVHPEGWARVGAGNEAVNHSRTAGWNGSRLFLRGIVSVVTLLDIPP